LGALQHVAAAHEAVMRSGVRRAVAMIKIDDRRDARRAMEDELEPLRRALREGVGKLKLQL